MDNLVSIYIPTKNRAALLKRAICSVLSQTVRNLELIVVSDGSEDATCDYVRSIDSDIKVTLLHNEKSVGACEARNQAIRIANGKFVTGLDDDDIFLPHRIQMFLEKWELLERTGTRFSCLFDRRVVNVGSQVWLWDTETTVSPERILSTNAIGNQVFTTPGRLIESGLFDSGMPAWQDWEMWVRLLKKFGPGESICANTYVMDISHEFERITMKSSEKIISAAQRFYQKHCGRENLPGLLRSLGGYDQIKLSLSDLFVLLRAGEAKFAMRQIRQGKYAVSWSDSILATA